MATVPTETSEIDFTGDGIVTEFPCGFPILEESDLVVQLTLDGAAEATLQVRGIDYTVVAAPAANATVSMSSPPPANSTLHIERTVAIVQEVNLLTQGAFSPSTHTEMHDRRTMVEQQLARRLARLEALASLVSIAAFDAQLVDITFTANASEIEDTFAGGALYFPVVVAEGAIVTGVLVARVQVTGDEARDAIMVLDWEYAVVSSTTGTVQINYITGLEPGLTYTISLLLLSL